MPWWHMTSCKTSVYHAAVRAAAVKYSLHENTKYILVATSHGLNRLTRDIEMRGQTLFWRCSVT